MDADNGGRIDNGANPEMAEAPTIAGTPTMDMTTRGGSFSQVLGSQR